MAQSHQELPRLKHLIPRLDDIEINPVGYERPEAVLAVPLGQSLQLLDLLYQFPGNGIDRHLPPLGIQLTLSVPL